MDVPKFPEISDIVSWPLIAFVFIAAIVRQYLKGKQYNGREKLRDKVVVITGGNCGIAKQMVRDLNYRGAKVYVGCLDAQKAQDGLSELAKLGCAPDRMIFIPLNLAKFGTVRKFVEEIETREQRIDVLINCAGLMMLNKFHMTEDNHEYQWQVNYLGHVLLTHLLLPLLRRSEGVSRIVHVSCRANGAAELDLDNIGLIDDSSHYDSRSVFARSKLALIMHSRALTRQLRAEGSNITINSCCPGLSYTRHFRHTPVYKYPVLRYSLAPVMWMILKTPKDGAQTPLMCVLDPKLDGVSGKYFSECSECEPNPIALDDDACDAMMKYTLDQIGF